MEEISSHVRIGDVDMALVEDGVVRAIVPAMLDGLKIYQRYSPREQAKMAPTYGGVTPGWLWDGQNFHHPGGQEHA